VKWLCICVLKLLVILKGEGHDLLMEFKAHKEKLMKEQLTLFDKKRASQVLLVFHARVLGKLSFMYINVKASQSSVKCVGPISRYIAIGTITQS